jgi:hypothetical protein
LLNSHAHGNGFAKLHLFDTDDQMFRVRAHIWSRAQSDFSFLNVHNHRYDFLSLVGSGSLENVVWKIDPGGEIFTSFVYHPRTENGAYKLIANGAVGLSVESVQKLRTGDLYFLGRDELHYTRPGPEECSVTFFIAHRRQLNSHARTYSQHHPPEEAEVHAPAVNRETYLSHLEMLKPILARSPSALVQ